VGASALASIRCSAATAGENSRRAIETRRSEAARRRGGEAVSSALERRDPNSLAARHPALAQERCAEKNGDLRPEAVPPNSGRIVWWRCEATPPHTWQAAVRIRVRCGAGCLACRRRAASLAARYPDLAAQWDRERNGALRPEDVPAKTIRKAWWRCPREPARRWYARIADRTLKKSGCAICAGKRVISETSLAALHPALAAEWHPQKNRSLRPSDVTPGSEKKLWWRCARDPTHEWQAQVNHRSLSGVGCPWCRERRREERQLFALCVALKRRMTSPRSS
jgi:hypothetical protein